MFEIDFTRFRIRDLESGTVLFEIAKPPSEQFPEGSVEENTVNNDEVISNTDDTNNIDTNAGRYVRYQFTPQFLKLKTVGATWVFESSLFLSIACDPIELESSNYEYIIYVSFHNHYYPEWSLRSVQNQSRTFVWLNVIFSVTIYWKHSILSSGIAFHIRKIHANTCTNSPDCPMNLVSAFNQRARRKLVLNILEYDNYIPYLFIHLQSVKW